MIDVHLRNFEFIILIENEHVIGVNLDELIVLDVLEDRNGLIGLKEVEKSV
jgi:hypothetical protein